MPATAPIDLERVICRLADIADPGARAFRIGPGAWPLRGFVVRVREAVRGYVNHCPHAGHPLDLVPGGFLTPDGMLILCGSHGAVFDRLSGYCIAGPCAGRSLQPIALRLEGDFVLLADEVNVGALARSIDEPT
jgi:nitrite reductase/ring-hydroxylating ferredoxin subunit